MPIVPAAGYPTGPEAPPQVPLDVPDDYSRVRATPESFGAQVGQSMSALGRVLTKSADEFNQVAIERQQLHNKVVSDNQINNFNDKANNLLYGDPNAPPGTPEAIGFYGLRGQAAIDAYPKIRAALQASREQMRGSLENPMQQILFDQETRRQMSLEMGRAGSHYDQQYDVFQSDTNKASAAAAQQRQDRAALANDDIAFNAAVKDAMDAGMKQLQAAGEDKNPDAVNAMLSRVRTDAVERRIKGYIGTGNTDAAAAVLTREAGPDGALSVEQAAAYRKILDGIEADRAAHRALQPSGGAVVPYTPATDLLSGTGMSAAQYDTFRSTLAARESQSYAQPPNAGGYMGRYQMGTKEIADTAARLGVPVPTQQQFLGDPALQERFFENYTLDHHNQLMQESQQYRAASPSEKAAILMGAHLGGVQGVEAYLAGRSDKADSNGTRISDYVTMGRRALGGSAAPAATPATNQPAATPAQPAAAAPGTIEVWGDSLGVGLKGALKAKGNSVGGAQPTAILADIKAQPENSWAGKTVVLSSGSNGRQMDKVEETIKYLQAHNANVVVVGYGSDPKASLPEKNAQLREIAGRLKVPVVDAEEVGSDGIHPSPQGYRSMGEKIRSAAAGQPAAAKPATAGEGAIITGPNGERLQNKGGKWVDLTTGRPYEQQSAGP